MSVTTNTKRTKRADNAGPLRNSRTYSAVTEDPTATINANTESVMDEPKAMDNAELRPERNACAPTARVSGPGGIANASPPTTPQQNATTRAFIQIGWFL
jgi:hypothetical protein